MKYLLLSEITPQGFYQLQSVEVRVLIPVVSREPGEHLLVHLHLVQLGLGEPSRAK